MHDTTILYQSLHAGLGCCGGKNKIARWLPGIYIRRMLATGRCSNIALGVGRTAPMIFFFLFVSLFVASATAVLARNINYCGGRKKIRNSKKRPRCSSSSLRLCHLPSAVFPQALHSIQPAHLFVCIFFQHLDCTSFPILFHSYHI